MNKSDTSIEKINKKQCVNMFFILFVFSLIPFVIRQFFIAVNTNHAWLLIAAERFLDGGIYGKDFFEPNPPMSIIFYIPQYLLHSSINIPLYFTPAITAFTFLFICSLNLIYILHKSDILKSYELQLVIVSSYIACSLFVPQSIYFSERDHFVFMALIPLCSAQIALTGSKRMPLFYTSPLFFFCGLTLLLKPHYGIFPLLILLHRFYSHKSFKSVFFSSDFIALSASFLCYALIIFLYFSSYIQFMAGIFINIYFLDLRDSLTAEIFQFALFFIPAAIMAPFLKLEKETENLIYLLVIGGFTSIFCYMLQGKGYYYQTIPAVSFFFMSYIALFWGTLNKIKISKHKNIITFSLTLAITLIYFYSKSIHENSFLTHKEYATLPLVQEIQKCGHPCPHFVFSQTMETVFQSSLYSKEENISRFPGLWWLYSMYDNPDFKSEIVPLKQAILDDIEHHQPKMLVIATNLEIKKGEVFNFMHFLSDMPDFKLLTDQYEFSHVLHDDRRYYFRGTILDYSYPFDYDIYYLIEKKPPAD